MRQPLVSGHRAAAKHGSAPGTRPHDRPPPGSLLGCEPPLLQPQPQLQAAWVPQLWVGLHKVPATSLGSEAAAVAAALVSPVETWRGTCTTSISNCSRRRLHCRHRSGNQHFSSHIRACIFTSSIRGSCPHLQPPATPQMGFLSATRLNRARTFVRVPATPLALREQQRRHPETPPACQENGGGSMNTGGGGSIVAQEWPNLAG